MTTPELRGLSRVVAFVVAIPSMIAGALLGLEALYGLATGRPTVLGGSVIVQALSAGFFLALLIGGVRLLVFATNARNAQEREKPEQPADDTDRLPKGPLTGRARLARAEARVGHAVSGVGLGLVLLSFLMRWDVGPIAGILLILHGGLISIAGKALARTDNWAWLAQAMPIGFLVIWRLTYCAEALLDRCP